MINLGGDGILDITDDDLNGEGEWLTVYATGTFAEGEFPILDDSGVLSNYIIGGNQHKESSLVGGTIKIISANNPIILEITGSDTKAYYTGDIEIIEETDIAVACFSYSPTTDLQIETEISFTNCSENATSYTWDFGDGNTSIEVNPTHIYEAEGEFIVTLIATNETTTNSYTQSIIIEPAGSGYFLSVNNKEYEIVNTALTQWERSENVDRGSFHLIFSNFDASEEENIEDDPTITGKWICDFYIMSNTMADLENGEYTFELYDEYWDDFTFRHASIYMIHDFEYSSDNTSTGTITVSKEGTDYIITINVTLANGIVLSGNYQGPIEHLGW
jgi:PKD repeat protein